MYLDCLAANLRCWQALQVLDSKGSIKAFQVLEKAGTSMNRVDEKETDLFRLTEARYLFTVGKAHQEAYHPETAREEFLKSLRIMDQLLGDHTDKARCLNAIGNCYQLLEEPDHAIKYFNRAYDMRKKLSGEKHYDMPVYKSQIGAVFDRKGDHDKAIEWYQSAIDLEKKLKISGYESTATFYRNIANAYLFKEQFAEAMEPAQKAYDIRKEVLGDHPDTTRSIFQLGLIWNLQEEREKAVTFYKEAWEMEKSLEKGHHSAVRDRIVEDLRELYDDLHRKKEKRLFEEDALNFYCRIWDEEKSFKEFQFSASTRKIIHMIIDLYKTLGSKEAEMKGYQEEALRLYEETWEQRDTLPELKWDKKRTVEKSVIKARGEILERIIELSQAQRDKGKAKQFEKEKLNFYKEVFFAEGSVDIEEYRRTRLLENIVKLCKLSEAQEFGKDALRFYDTQWKELGSKKEEELGHSRREAIDVILIICSKLRLKQKLSQYQKEALTFYKKLWGKKRGKMEMSDRKSVVQTIIKLASSLKEKATEKEYKRIKEVKSSQL